MKLNRKKFLFSIAVILTFLLAYYGRRIIGVSFSTTLGNTIYYYSWWILPTLITAGSLFGFQKLKSTFGLDQSILKAFGFAMLAVLPMFIGYAAIGRFNADPDVFRLMRSTLFAGFFEELLFRGFLFGILFRKLGWGFIPAAILGAVFFGIAHIYQGSGFGQSAGIFLLTAVGSLWFAWLYIEWEGNLWVPIFLHILMNLSWGLFEIGDNALGGVSANIFRVMTIVITVVMTIRRIKSKGAAINRTNLIRTSL